jgi:branched-subunit amino acid transport protein
VVANVTAAWITIGALALATAAIKAAGPVALGGRPLPPRVTAVVVLLAPAILAALVVTETFASGRSLAIDERAAGLIAAAAAIWLRASLPVVVIVAAVAAAAARAIA